MPVQRLNGNGRRILVIDDDLAIRVLLQAVLKRMHFEVELAEDGLEGLERLKSSGTFDLILLDLMMPRLNGYDFLDQVTALYPDQARHIVVFTAAGKRGVEKIPESAVCSSILKPFDLDKFIDIIGECVRGDHSR